MKSNNYLIFLIFLSALYSCNISRSKSDLIEQLESGRVIEYTLPGEPSLRGVDVLDSKVVWISGSKGTFARSVDAGNTWQSGKINNDTLLDFRDIHAISSESAIAISAGSPARIYKTINGGETWSLKYQNVDSLIFFNSFDFCDINQGIACSDPIYGNFFFIKTINGGETWDTIKFSGLPKPLSVEGGFAASGTSVAFSSNGTILFGTGGEEARVIRSDDFGQSWVAIKTPIIAGKSSYGIYSIGLLKDNSFVIAGGCWEKPDEALNNVAISIDSGKNWSLTKSFPSGFRSCIKYLPNSESILTCGTNGVDVSLNNGDTWQKLPFQGYNAFDISCEGDFLVFVGSHGKLAFASSKNRNKK